MDSSRTKYRKLADQIRSGQIVRVGKNIYSSPEELEGIEGDFYRATLLCGRKSAICLLSALQFYGLSEHIFGNIWILLPHTSYLPRKKVLRPMRSRRPFWRTGIVSTPRYKITNIERTIVDAFRYHRVVGISVAVMALQLALKEKKTTKEKIFEMSKKLKASKIILPYLEAS